ncbi:type IVB pilus formation R64 PilN family outer membrane protein [Robbsia andropogonis]
MTARMAGLALAHRRFRPGSPRYALSMARMACVSFVLSGALVGCTGLQQRLSNDVDADHAQSEGMLEAARHGDVHPGTSPDGVVVRQGLWLSGKPIKLQRTESLPPIFSEPVTFDRDVASVQQFAQRISQLTHLPARVAPSALQGSDGGARANAGVPVQGAKLPPLPPGMGGDTGALSSSAPGNDAYGYGGTVHIAYRHGDLQGLLDAAATRFGLSWKYADGAVVFYLTDTRTFQVDAIPGDASINANVMSGASSDSGGGNGAGGNSGSGGYGSGGAMTSGSGGNGNGQSSVTSNNTANTVVNSTLSVYSSLRASIQAMLSRRGTVVTSPATGTITVTDTPDVLARVGSFMDEANQSLSKQVLINVTVLSVTLSSEDNYGINWNAVYQALGSAFSLSGGFASTVSNPVSLSANVISPRSRASGTASMISALSQQGKVRRKTSASITTLNNQPVPVQVATQQGYLASVSTTATLNVGTQTSLTPGTVTTGFNMTLLPHVLDDGTVLMQFYTNISSLSSLTTVSSGNEQIQTPEVATRNFLQRVSMKSGETLVLSGYEGTDDNLTRQGVGRPENYALGGGYDASRSREVIVILITPVTMNGA